MLILCNWLLFFFVSCRWFVPAEAFWFGAGFQHHSKMSRTEQQHSDQHQLPVRENHGETHRQTVYTVVSKQIYDTFPGTKSKFEWIIFRYSCLYCSSCSRLSSSTLDLFINRPAYCLILHTLYIIYSSISVDKIISKHKRCFAVSFLKKQTLFVRQQVFALQMTDKLI